MMNIRAAAARGHAGHDWPQVARGAVSANGGELKQGDGLAFSGEKLAVLAAGSEGAEVLLFDPA